MSSAYPLQLEALPSPRKQWAYPHSLAITVVLQEFTLAATLIHDTSSCLRQLGANLSHATATAQRTPLQRANLPHSEGVQEGGLSIMKFRRQNNPARIGSKFFLCIPPQRRDPIAAQLMRASDSTISNIHADNNFRCG